MNNNLYKKILDNLYYEVFVTDNKGIILYCNEAFSKNYSVDTNDIIGKHVSIIAPLIKNGQQIVPIALKAGHDVSLFQETVYNKKLFLNAKPIFNEDGQISMILENAREVLDTSTNINGDSKNLESMFKENMTSFLSIDILKHLKRISKFDVAILLLGESGTGKSTCARFIHDLSNRYDKPFFTINCTTIPEHLIESELFGYVKGAFTGAVKEGKKGLVELANKGTLFLDEIGELPLGAQSKLLELIENKTFIPVGGTTKEKADIRILTATNRDLKKMIGEKTFREDLYYRLNTFEFKLPPLRERKDDIPFLANVFIDKTNKKYNLNKKFSDNVLIQFKTYDWPGNIRQLEHAIEKIMIASEPNLITISNLEHLFDYSKPTYIDKDEMEFDLPTLKEELEERERSLFEKAYLRYGSSYKVAKALDISQSQASRKIRKYGLEDKK